MKAMMILLALVACDVPVVGQTEQAVEVQVLRFGPFAQSPLGVGYRSPTGVVNNYTDPSLATHTVLTWKGADNNGTVLTGIDATGLVEGDVRIWINPSDSGIDVGSFILKNEDERSLPENRFTLPSATDYLVAINAPFAAMRVRNENNEPRWAPLFGQSGRMKRAFIQSLQIYPGIQIGTAANPLCGTQNNWAPVGEPTFGGMGIDGSDLQGGSHTLWRVYTCAAGATVTGIGVGTDLNGSVNDFGPVKIIKNYGPGKLTIAHRGSSTSPNQILAPNDADVTLGKGEAAWLIKPYFAGPESPVTAQWHVIGIARGDVRDRFEAGTLKVTTEADLQAVRMRGRITPDQLPTGVVDVWDPVDMVTGASFHGAYHLRGRGNVGTILCGLAPGVEGERHLFTNYSSDYILRSDCPGTPHNSRFVIPGGGDKTHRYKGHFEIQYDSQWLVLIN